MYGGQDLNSMYLAAYNGAQASMAWQFQQQMMGGMLMQMQQMQMNQRLQAAKAQRARQAAVQKEKAEAKAKAQAAQAAQAHAKEAERVRVAAEALMRLKSQNSQKPGSSLGSELPNIGSTLLKELNGFNASQNAASSTAPTFSSALGSLGSVGSVLSAAATAKAPVKATATAATGDASSQSTKVGRCGKNIEETSKNHAAITNIHKHHKNCKCTTSPVIDDLVDAIWRIAYLFGSGNFDFHFCSGRK